MSLAVVRIRDGAVEYRRLLRWRRLPRTEVISSGVIWSPFIGYLRLQRPQPPWGRLLFILDRYSARRSDRREGIGIVAYLCQNQEQIQRADLCPESELRRAGSKRSAGTEAAAGREYAAEEAGGRLEPGERHAAVGDPKKLAELAVRRAEVQRLREDSETSERHACELMRIPRSSCRYRSRREDGVLRERLIQLAREKPRFGRPATSGFVAARGERVNQTSATRVSCSRAVCAAHSP
jgi:hypothetical protein